MNAQIYKGLWAEYWDHDLSWRQMLNW